MTAGMARILRIPGGNGYPPAVAFRGLFGRGSPAAPDHRFERANAEIRQQALASVLGAGAVASPGFERRAQEQGIDLSLVWAATVDGRLDAGALLVPHPGRSGLLMATSPRDHGHARVVGQLVATLLRECASLPEVRLVQALSAPSEPLRSQAWTLGGMRHLASLDYMERPLGTGTPPGQDLPPGIRLAAWEPAERAMLQRLLVDTYVETLDCPGLAQMRDPADILDGHLAAGEHDPELWTIAWRGDRPVAALLLSPSQATESLEVVYLGIVPDHRAKGLGRALMSHAMSISHGRPERVIALAVDSRNTPAMALYARSGFRTLRRREAFVASLGG